MSETRPLRRGLLFAFALPAIMEGLMHAPEAQVQGIYAKYTGLSLGALATGLLLTRIFDAVTYPLIGQWSDAAFRRSGSRKGLMAFGTAVAVFGVWNLFRPPPAPSIVYYTGWAMVTYFGWKLTEIPYGAWSLGLTHQYTQRARVQLWRFMAALSGSILFFAVPLLSKALGFSETSELNLHTLAFTAILVLLCMPLANGLAFLRVPNSEVAQAPPPEATKPGLREMFAAVVGNQPLLRLLLAAAPVIALNGVSSGTVFLFADVYLHLGKQLPLIQIIGLPLSLVGLLFWTWLCQKYERHRVWAISLAVAGACDGLLALVPTGPVALVPILVLYPISMFSYICIAIAFPAMLGDVVDYERLRTGEDRAGIYSAINSFLQKSMTAVSGAFGIALVGWFGFDAHATDQTSWGGFGIRLATMGLPAAGFLISAFLAWGYPISRARQEQILEAVEARDARTLHPEVSTPGDALPGDARA